MRRLRPSAVKPPEIAANAGKQAIDQLDANHDNLLDYNELAKAPGLRAAVATIKKLAVFRGPPPQESQVRAAKISAEEIDARVQQWKDRGVGRISISCHVYRVGKPGAKHARQPVVGAEVKFVPEPFLGPGMPTGAGTTDKTGLAAIVQPSTGPTDPPGMAPGFYRVEITKGTEIPPQYNTATVLGQEVASDALGLSGGGAAFELEY